ncbi:MAG TPA: prepilin peptidase [Blastocatellia bacterium]|nr:prepilin peptidase [Blastocatellia bacterium]
MLTALTLLSATTAAYFDFRWRRIPNWLVAATIVLSLSYHSWSSGLEGFKASGAGLLVGGALLFPLYLLKGMGAGDVKFFAAIGAAVTFQHIIAVFVFAALIAGGMALFRVVAAHAFVATLSNIADILNRFFHGRIGPHPVARLANENALVIPFGVSVAAATWLFVLLGSK